MVKLSILIVNWNSADYLEQCLDSLFTHLPEFPCEVIVVDNNSADNSVEVLRRYKNVHVIENQYNYGFAVANNQAFRVSNGEYVMPINPDTRLQKDTLEILVRALDESPDVGIASPVLVSNGALELPTMKLTLFPPSRTFGLLFSLFRGGNKAAASEGAIYDEEIPAKWVLGTGYICRRSAVQTDNLFVEDTFLFSEEYYLCDQVRQSGFKIAIYPRARIEHFKSVTFKFATKRSIVANRLLTASAWRARRDFCGVIPAALSSGYIAVDNALIWALMSVWKRGQVFFGRSVDQTFLLAYWSAMVTSIKLLVFGEKYFTSVNKDTRTFFNWGIEPPFPPLTR